MSTRKSDPHKKPPLHHVPTYWERAQWPLQALYFLLPLVVGYEIGTVVFAPAGEERLPAILAESLLGGAFEWVGVTGVYLPGFLVVAVLLGWHIMRKDPWQPEPQLYAGMLAESVFLTIPLIVLGLVMSRDHAPASAPGDLGVWGGDILAAAQQHAQPQNLSTFGLGPKIVFSVGAGIYEELFFRLIGIALLHLLFVDVLALPERWGAILAVVFSALAFALYHFRGVMPWDFGLLRADFDAGRFVFYTVAGVYFAGIYVVRGFGIVAVVHALYDVAVLTVKHYNE